MCIIQMGTLSKAFGSSGGFITGSQAMTDYLRVGATSYIFTASLPAALAAAALEAMDIAKLEPWRREKALGNAAYIRENVVNMGFDVGPSSTQIVPIIIGDETKTRAASSQLLRAGIYAPSVEFPAAARGRARIRLSHTALHELDHLDRLLGVLEDLASHESYKASSGLRDTNSD
jgi:7-keto-8-aminopelargonate synthetase-like enzyme